MNVFKKDIIFIILRLCMGFIFLWAFLDKLFGLGFATKSDKSWLTGTSPTYGFLKFGAQGYFQSVFQSLAGNTTVDILFMSGLLLLGTALILGIGVRIAAYGGALLMMLMWLSLFPPENNPFLDEHIIYILVLFILEKTQTGSAAGFGKWWVNTNTVKKYPILA